MDFSILTQHESMCISKCNLLNLLLNLDFDWLESNESHLVLHNLINSKLPNIASTPGVHLSLSPNDSIMVASSLCISTVDLHSLGHLEALIVAMAEAAAATIAPGVDITVAHEAEAVLESTRDHNRFLFYEKVEDVVRHQVSHQE